MLAHVESNLCAVAIEKTNTQTHKEIQIRWNISKMAQNESVKRQQNRNRGSTAIANIQTIPRTMIPNKKRQTNATATDITVWIENWKLEFRERPAACSNDVKKELSTVDADARTP